MARLATALSLPTYCQASPGKASVPKGSNFILGQSSYTGFTLKGGFYLSVCMRGKVQLQCNSIFMFILILHVSKGRTGSLSYKLMLYTSPLPFFFKKKKQKTQQTALGRGKMTMKCTTGTQELGTVVLTLDRTFAISDDSATRVEFPLFKKGRKLFLSLLPQ